MLVAASAASRSCVTRPLLLASVIMKAVLVVLICSLAATSSAAEDSVSFPGWDEKPPAAIQNRVQQQPTSPSSRRTTNKPTTSSIRVQDGDKIHMPDQVVYFSTNKFGSSSTVSPDSFREKSTTPSKSTTWNKLASTTTTEAPTTNDPEPLVTRLMANAPERGCEVGYVKNRVTGQCRKTVG